VKPLAGTILTAFKGIKDDPEVASGIKEGFQLVAQIGRTGICQRRGKVGRGILSGTIYR
jgi:hypothetical protein